MHDVMVVGSGAAGTWTAYQLAKEGRTVLMLDVGLKPRAQPPLSSSFLNLRRGSPHHGHDLLGDRFETLSNVAGPYQSPKLNAPRFRFVTDRASELGPLRTGGATITQSFAYGGLANAWGAGTYRFTSDDLRHFPLPAGVLEPFYDEITRAIGISGTEDDLAAHFGSAAGLQPPLRLDRLAAHALAGYERRRSRFRAHGFTIGRPRLAVLSERLNGRTACTYDNLSFWEPRLEYVYIPAWTLDPLIASGAIDYLDQKLVLSFREADGRVEVVVRDLATGAEQVFAAARLVLAAGALNTARLVLRSFNDFSTTLPLLDNLPSMVPFLSPRFIGAALDPSAHGLGQLNIVFREHDAADYLQGTFYSYTALLASEVIMDIPLPARGTVAASKFLLPGLSVVTFFYPAEPHPGNHVRLDQDGTLAVSYEESPVTGRGERRFASLMRGCGFWSHPTLFRVSPRGAGIHYAGTLPMRAQPGEPYTTDAAGRLQQCKGVFVADAATFPFLPAKNHTFTVMANAMRVGREVSASLNRA
jgi:choline dehydrogenase-like flavoprotein